MIIIIQIIVLFILKTFFKFIVESINKLSYEEVDSYIKESLVNYKTNSPISWDSRIFRESPFSKSGGSGSALNRMFSKSDRFSNSWQTLIKSVGIDDFCWHYFRHCCGSYLRQDGKDLGIIGREGSTLALSLLPVQCVIRTFLAKRLLRKALYAINKIPRPNYY